MTLSERVSCCTCARCMDKHERLRASIRALIADLSAQQPRATVGNDQ